jgi:hypothetical protein
MEVKETTWEAGHQLERAQEKEMRCRTLNYKRTE